MLKKEIKMQTIIAKSEMGLKAIAEKENCFVICIKKEYGSYTGILKPKPTKETKK